jgi:hypothetical protein
MGQVRDDRLCHRLILFMVSGFRCQQILNPRMKLHEIQIGPATVGRPTQGDLIVLVVVLVLVLGLEIDKRTTASRTRTSTSTIRRTS